MSCDGDPLQMCGGENRLQIFGPPPSTPAVGHNVVPKCEPWCVTADSNTANVCTALLSLHIKAYTLPGNVVKGSQSYAKKSLRELLVMTYRPFTEYQQMYYYYIY